MLNNRVVCGILRNPYTLVVLRRTFLTTQTNAQKEFKITDDFLQRMKHSEDETQKNLELKFLGIFDKMESPFTARIAPGSALDNVNRTTKFTRFTEEDNQTDDKFEFDDQIDPKILDNLLYPVNKKDNVIILNTRAIYDHRRRKVARPSKKSNSWLMKGFDIDNRDKLSKSSRTDPKEYFKAIDLHKPIGSLLHTKQYEKVALDLSKLFTKLQLKTYIEVHGSLSGTSLYKKLEYANHILSTIWEVEKVNVVNNLKDLIKEEVIPLDTRSLKLLLSNSGVVIFTWRSLGADVAIDKYQRLTIRASESVILYIRIMINNILDSSGSVTIDVSAFKNSENDLFMDYLSSITDVFYEKNGSNLSLSALKEHRLFAFKQLLLLSVHIHSFNENEVMTEFQGEKFVVKNTGSIPEIYNYKNWFRYQEDKQRKNVELNGEIFDDILDYETINDEIKDLMVDQLALEPTMEEITLNLFDKNFKESAKLFKEQNAVERAQQVSVSNYALEMEVADCSHEENSVTSNGIVDVDLAYEKLAGEEMYTASFGSILVDESDTDMIFNAHLPFINKKILKLPLFLDRASPDKDDFDYLYVIKMIPNPYANMSNVPKHAPIEFWFDTAGNYIDIKSLRILQSTMEKNLFYPLPQYKSDLKLTSTSLAEIDTNLEDQWLNDQPGIVQFLKDCSFSVSDFKESNIKDTCKINLGDEEVEYFVVGTQQRKQLELKFNGQLLQYNVIDNGHYGGKQLEVNLVGSLNQDMTRKRFDDFVANLIEFIKSL